MRGAGLLALALLAATVAVAVAGADAPAGQAGIWKAVVPAPGSMHGEFANNDPIALAAGVKVPADCSINWVDPDERKLYCFASATSLVMFLEAPHSRLASARAQWLQLKSEAR
jgi:hypothetical protein